MASLFAHALVGATVSVSMPGEVRRARVAMLAAFAAAAPDLDVAAFLVGIPYTSPWGHRGFTHSLVFAAALGPTLAALVPAARASLAAYARWSAFFAAVTASHPLLDMLTNGGKGVALFWPFTNERYFLPWRPIEVSPLWIGRFFGPDGWRVLTNEGLYIGLPCVAWLLVWWLRARRGPSR
jgi:inner membrane protein